jgi:mono/diheme cytochrome c family protein
LAGCGGKNHASGTELRQGRAVFVRSCTGCHTLTGRDTDVPGGDLAIARLPPADLRSFIRVMPVHLSRAELDAVVVYVAAVASGRAAGPPR